MLLGKRVRHPMKRTTSMTEFSFDDLTIIQPSDQLPPLLDRDRRSRNHNHNHNHNHNQTVMAMVSPRPIHRRNSADFALHSTSANSPTFLNTCALCNRRLAPGRDIYMYRGDSGFCSLECRQQQMAEDEWREKEKKGVQVAKESNQESNQASLRESNQPSHTNTNTHTHTHSYSSPAGSPHVSSVVAL